MKKNQIEEELITAVANLNILQIKHLLHIGTSPNTKNSTGYSVLQLAVWLNHLEMVELFLSYGANINDRNYNGNTPLHTATWLGRRNAEGIKATEKDLLTIVKLLLNAGADLHSINLFGMTALHHAAFHGHTTIVATLLDHGADPQCQIQAINILANAAYPEHLEQFQKTGLTSGMTALHIAAKYNFCDIVKLLLKSQL